MDRWSVMHLSGIGGRVARPVHGTVMQPMCINGRVVVPDGQIYASGGMAR